MTSDRPRGRRLTAVQVAEAAVLGDLAVGLCLLGFLLPFGGLFIGLAVAPIAALSARHRLAVAVAAGVSASVTGLLLAGPGLAVTVAACTAIGSVVGAAERRGWSRRRTMAVGAAVVWPLGSGLTIGLVALLTAWRHLLLDQVAHLWRGVAKLLRPHAPGIAHRGDVWVAWLVGHWWLAVAVWMFVIVEAWLFSASVLSRPTLARIAGVGDPEGRLALAADVGEPGAVPIVLHDVGYRYPGFLADALQGVSLDVAPATMVAVVGSNGSGKSTLARILAGRSPSRGSVERPGAVGLGRPGGTAVVFQRPESQVLGMRVRDDVIWGLSAADRPDVDALLNQVGLAGFADRDTSTLSGGELQRLAVAGALARRPALLISDESTAMVDVAGRRELTEVFAGLPAAGITVVHVTHHEEEARAADRVIRLAGGQVVGVGGPSGPASPAPLVVGDRRRPPTRGPELVRLRNVGHVYDGGSPWAHRALHDVDLAIGAGEGVVITGPNGSGKSTLAWILAGLVEPSEGSATIGGRPLSASLDQVALSFQHARLQLQRSRVRADVMAAARVDRAAADDALRSVGLDPTRFGDRRIDDLSGGEQRRAVLAGMLAGRPRLVVLDEPFAGLDHDARRLLVDALVEARRRGVTLVLISHDLDGCEPLADRLVRLDGGRLVSDSWPLVGKPGAAGSGRGRTGRIRRPAELRLFRLLPKPGPLRRLWAGTKLLAVVAMAAAVSISPTWWTLAVEVGLVGLALWVERIGPRAFPRLPRWFWVAMTIGLALNFIAGGRPYLSLGPVSVGFGAAYDWILATALALVVLAAAALVSWTTPLAQITPAVHRLARPLGWMGLPVEQWSVVTALGLRCVPMLIDETRVLVAARRLRSAHAPAAGRGVRAGLGELIDLLAAATTSAVRRAAELADAMESRGGVDRFHQPDGRPGWIDAAVLAGILAALGAALLA